MPTSRLHTAVRSVSTASHFIVFYWLSEHSCLNMPQGKYGPLLFLGSDWKIFVHLEACVHFKAETETHSTLGQILSNHICLPV